LVSGDPLTSLMGQIWLTRDPTTHGPGITSTTVLIPPPHVPVRAGRAVAVGSENIGPTPQINLPGLAGVKKSCSWISPKPPFCALLGPGKLWKGTMVRNIKLTLDERWIGMTGWKFRLK